jgi:hypothetical protein
MARYPYQSFIQDGNGRAIEDVTVTVYEADTTTEATIYAAKSGGSAITGSYVTTSASGYFLFYIDDSDYATLQLFDLVPAKSGYEFDTIADVVVNGVSYQPLDAGLTDIAALAVTDSNIIVGDGTNWVAESGATARASLGLAIGTNVQAYNAYLLALAALDFGPSRVNKTQADSPYTVTNKNLTGLVVFTNTGATGETIFNLPAGADGYKVRADVTAAQYLRLDANGTETIRYLATQTAVGGYIRSNVVGNVVELDWSGTEWVVVNMGGAWTYDS